MLVKLPKTHAERVRKFLATENFNEPDNKKLSAKVEAFCSKYKIGANTQEGIYKLACHVRAQQSVHWIGWESADLRTNSTPQPLATSQAVSTLPANQ